MKRVKLLSIIVLLVASTSSLWAQTNLASWAFSGLSNGGASPFAPTSRDTNVTVVGLTKGSGMTAATAGSGWGGAGFQDDLTNAADQSEATAIARNNFATFSIKANTGYTESFSGIGSYNIRRSSTGPQTMIWQYSLDGTNFTDIGGPITIGTLTSAAGNEQPSIDLSGIAALQNVATGVTVTFRMVMWNAAGSGNGGTWYLNAGSGAVSNTLNVLGIASPSSPLPLTLISFKGSQAQSVNHLNWITANEKYISHFELEKATDGSHFSKIADINSAVKSDAANNNYSYDDKSVSSSSFYRLKIVEVGGNATYSDVVVIRSGNVVSNISLYPNPAADHIFISGLKGLASYDIIDITGKVMVIGNSEAMVDGTVKSIDISNLLNGIYTIRIGDDNGSNTLRFIKK